MLLSQQSRAASGSAGKMEHAVLEESRGTASANLAGLALTGRSHRAPPAPSSSNVSSPRLLHLPPTFCPRNVRHIPPTSPVSSFSWLKGSILHAHFAGGKTEPQRNSSRKQSWTQESPSRLQRNKMPAWPLEQPNQLSALQGLCWLSMLLKQFPQLFLNTDWAKTPASLTFTLSSPSHPQEGEEMV